MSSIIPSDWDIIALFQKCNLKSAKLNYCARVNLHRTQTLNFFTHISRNLFKGMPVFDSSNSNFLTITQSQSHKALISARFG